MRLSHNIIVHFHVVNDVKWLNNTILLLKHLYRIVPLSDVELFLTGGKLKNACHLTFDDGDSSFYNNVFPLVKKYHIPVSIYVSPKIVIEKKIIGSRKSRDTTLLN